MPTRSASSASAAGSGPNPMAPISPTGYIRDPLYADRTVAWLEDRYARRAAGDEEALKRSSSCAASSTRTTSCCPRFMRQGRPTRRRSPAADDPPSPTDDEDLSSKPALHSAYRGAYYSGCGHPTREGRAYERNAAEYRELYYRFHHDVDGPIDRVRKAVTDNADDAVLVFSADHGDLLGSHGGLHQKWYQLYDEAVRVPFQIAGRSPGIRRHRSSARRPAISTCCRPCSASPVLTRPNSRDAHADPQRGAPAPRA